MKKITDVIKKMNTTDKNLLVNMLGALLIKGAGLFLSLFTMPVYMSYFNDDVTLGLWFTILSVLHWVLYFDLGIGNGLRNCLTESLTLGDQKQAKTYISSAYVSIGAFCLISSLVFIAISFFINWNQVFNISDTTVSSSALQSTTCIVFIGILLQLFLLLSLTIFSAGALGNAIERLNYGYVIDYVKLNFIDFPVFNAFDIMICIGIGLYCLSILLDLKHGTNKN